MSHFGRASALLLLLSIPVSWVVVRLSGIENSPQVNITYDRYFIFFILLFLLTVFVLACIALHRKEKPRFVSKVSFAVALCALLFLGWQLASRMINNSKIPELPLMLLLPTPIRQEVQYPQMRVEILLTLIVWRLQTKTEVFCQVLMRQWLLSAIGVAALIRPLSVSYRVVVPSIIF